MTFPIRALVIGMTVLNASRALADDYIKRDFVYDKKTWCSMYLISSTYNEFKTTKDGEKDLPPGLWNGGVIMDGQLARLNKDITFHYIQVVTQDTGDSLRWIKDPSVALPKPYVDAPMGGYVKQRSFKDADYGVKQETDFMPYYDDKDTKDMKFTDVPSQWLRSADEKTTYSDRFETWVVAVCKQDVKGGKAQNDVYKVAPLIGWTWGFDISFKKVAIEYFDPANFNVTKSKLGWIDAPSDAWKQGISKQTVYGAGDKKDWWDIQLCQAKDIVPAPGIPGLTLAAAILALRRRR